MNQNFPFFIQTPPTRFSPKRFQEPILPTNQLSRKTNIQAYEQNAKRPPDPMAQPDGTTKEFISIVSVAPGHVAAEDQSKTQIL